MQKVYFYCFKVAAAEKKDVEAKYKKKLSEERKKHKALVAEFQKSRVSSENSKQEETLALKQQIQRNEELFRLKLEVGRRGLEGEKKVNS